MPGPVSATGQLDEVAAAPRHAGNRDGDPAGALHGRRGVLAQVLQGAGDLVALADARQVGTGVHHDVDLLAELSAQAGDRVANHRADVQRAIGHLLDLGDGRDALRHRHRATGR